MDDDDDDDNNDQNHDDSDIQELIKGSGIKNEDLYEKLNQVVKDKGGA